MDWQRDQVREIGPVWGGEEDGLGEEADDEVGSDAAVEAARCNEGPRILVDSIFGDEGDWLDAEEVEGSKGLSCASSS
jgi:hypothetical protein